MKIAVRSGDATAPSTNPTQRFFSGFEAPFVRFLLGQKPRSAGDWQGRHATRPFVRFAPSRPLQIQEEIGDLHGATVSGYNLGELAENSGDTIVAEDLWRSCFESWISLKDRYRAAATLRSFALMRSLRDPERAAVAIGAAEAVIQLVEMHEPHGFSPKA
jgi:hypothetical protein